MLKGLFHSTLFKKSLQSKTRISKSKFLFVVYILLYFAHFVGVLDGSVDKSTHGGNTH